MRTFLYLLLPIISLLINIKYNSIYISAILIGIFWQQVSFIGHDLGHKAVTHIDKLEKQIGLVVGNILIGISIGWWNSTHNTHHVYTNSANDDPDIQHIPALCCSRK